MGNHCRREPNETSVSELFWYSRSTIIHLLASLMLVVIPIASLTPPFQSLDEFNHVKRAYLLSKGDIFLGSVNGVTGGYIDGGLLDYMTIFERFPFNYDEKFTKEMRSNAQRILWTGQRRFSELPNTAVYLPFSYAPQGVALFIGEKIGLNVSSSYYLARMLSLTAIAALLWLALTLYPIPLPVMGLLVTPMAIFQFAAASLDGVSFAVSVLVGSLFLRASCKNLSFGPQMHFGLALCLFLLSTTRMHLIGMILMLVFLYWVRRSRTFLVSAGMLFLLSVSWLIFAAQSVHGLELNDISPMEVLLYYSRHIGEFLSVIYSTLTSGVMLLGYWSEFVGVLGWGDAPLDSRVYVAITILLVVLGIISMPTNPVQIFDRGRLMFAMCAAISTGLLFVLMLATFTPHPAEVVTAIQGRYFYPTAIFLAFAVFGQRVTPVRAKIGTSILFFITIMCVVGTVPKLIYRYW